MIDLGDVETSEDVSILPKDEEMSMMLKDDFNKSINVSTIPGDRKLDRSVAIYSGTKTMINKGGNDELSPAPSIRELRAEL